MTIPENDGIKMCGHRQQLASSWNIQPITYLTELFVITISSNGTPATKIQKLYIRVKQFTYISFSNLISTDPLIHNKFLTSVALG